MGTFVEAGKTSEFKDGMMKEIVVQDNRILLARIGGKYYATANRCPHFGGNLSRGRLEGTVVTCPLHGSQFDLTDGHVVRWLKGSGILSAVGKALKRPKPLDTHKVKVEDNRILVEI
ncbi:MAG: Rieske 2Fe-2S domain-containing protein [Chloroflexi bacterium]|nr:Rieske 2Fe-2S domain-containing protein [Chloroflexota bacterium]